MRCRPTALPVYSQLLLCVAPNNYSLPLPLSAHGLSHHRTPFDEFCNHLYAVPCVSFPSRFTAFQCRGTAKKITAVHLRCTAPRIYSYPLHRLIFSLFWRLQNFSIQAIRAERQRDFLPLLSLRLFEPAKLAKFPFRNTGIMGASISHLVSSKIFKKSSSFKTAAQSGFF